MKLSLYSMELTHCIIQQTIANIPYTSSVHCTGTAALIIKNYVPGMSGMCCKKKAVSVNLFYLNFINLILPNLRWNKKRKLEDIVCSIIA